MLGCLSGLVVCLQPTCGVPCCLLWRTCSRFPGAASNSDIVPLPAQAWGGKGNHKVGDDYPCAPNIDHTQERIRNDLIEWLRYLRNSIGFDGWRFDFVRGYNGLYAKMYIDATVPAMAFGEYWDSCEYTDGVLNYNQDAHRQRTVNWWVAEGLQVTFP